MSTDAPNTLPASCVIPPEQEAGAGRSDSPQERPAEFTPDARRQAEAAAALRASLGKLAEDDPDLALDMIEGETSLFEAIADAFETGRTPDWFAIARAITGSHARDLGFPITERTDHDQA